MKTYYLNYVVFLFAIYTLIACSEKDNVQLDKQIRISFGSTGSSESYFNSTSWYLENNPGTMIPNFDKSYYSGLDSIIFAAPISENCIVELYNFSDNIPIDSSQIKWSTISLFQYSKNIIDYLPNKPITLGFRAKSTTNSFGAHIYGGMYLFLYR